MKEEKTDTDFTASRDFPFLKEGTQTITMGNEELNSISLSKEVSTTDFLPVKYKFRRCLEKSHNHVTTDSDAPDYLSEFLSHHSGWFAANPDCSLQGWWAQMACGVVLACLSSSTAQG